MRPDTGAETEEAPSPEGGVQGSGDDSDAQLADDPLHADYERMLKAGIKPKLAKLTLARKIAGTVLSMWKHQEVYDPKRHRPTPAQV